MTISDLSPRKSGFYGANPPGFPCRCPHDKERAVVVSGRYFSPSARLRGELVPPPGIEH